MIKIRALNEEVCESDEDEHQRGPTRETQEEEVLTLYHRALQLLSVQNVSEATEILEDLLQAPYLQNDENRKSCPLQVQVRLGCLKSLSTIYYTLNPSPEDAFRILIEATKLDSDNINLWCRLGCVSVKLVDYKLAKYAFHQAWKRNNGHWSSLENLITITYVLNDYLDCLYYCAYGIGRDSSFIKGMVFRDHIFEVLPYLKEDIEKRIPNSDTLIITTDYEDSWKDLYLREVRQLLEKQGRKDEDTTTSNLKTLSVINTSGICTLSGLCCFVRNLYTQVQSEGAILRPMTFREEDDDGSVESRDISKCIDEEEKQIVTDERYAPDDVSQTSLSLTRRSSSDEKETPFSNSESGTEMVEEKAEKAVTEDETTQNAKDSSAPKKKSKRDLKWWQLEGKRRSQRVRSLLVTPIQSNTTREHSFGEKLRSIIPESLLHLDEKERNNFKLSSTQANNVLVEKQDNYFGTDREIEDVKSLLRQSDGSNVLDLVSTLITFLTSKTDLEWPDNLRTEYLRIYQIYRSLIPRQNLFDASESQEERDRSDCRIVLTMLELLVEELSIPELEKMKNDSNFLSEIALINDFANTSDDNIFCARFGWLLSKFYLSLINTSYPAYDEVLYYLKFVETSLNSFPTPDLVLIRISTKGDNIISLSTVKRKVHLVRNLENVGRVNELYQSKMYEDLIGILDLCLKSDNGGNDQLVHRYYMADAYFNLNKFSECLEQALKIISICIICRENETILAKSVELVEAICLLYSFEKTQEERKQVLISMVDLLVTNDQKRFNSSQLWTTPWCTIHNILRNTEREQPLVHLFEESAPSSVVLLKFAHEYLSQFNRCLENNAKLLTYTLDSLTNTSNSSDYMNYEETKHCIEQAIFCLYCHPTKKSKFRYLTDHNCGGIQLKLEDCGKLFQYYRPKETPDFDSYDTISSEILGLFLKILTVLPEGVQPIKEFNHLKGYLDGKVEGLDESILGKSAFPDTLWPIYYLIGDHYFKSKEWIKAIEFYTWDLTRSMKRFNSWAGIALAKAEMINANLNSCDDLVIDDIILESQMAIKCFCRALELDPSNSKLRIEFGSFVYAMHANCSRFLKKHADQLDSLKFEMVLTKKRDFLSMAAECFERGVQKYRDDAVFGDLENESQHEELWIHHYMLGKVLEKLHPSDPENFLSHYETAGQLLHEHNAAYPAKLSFNNSPDLAIEALEIYYRIHASIVAYIDKFDYDPEMEKCLKKFIDRASESPFVKSKVVRGDGGDSKKKKANEKDASEIKQMIAEVLDKVVDICEVQQDTLTLSDSQCSTEDSSSWESCDESNDSETPKPPVLSFGLSAFRDKLREQDEAAKLRQEEEKRLHQEEEAVKLRQQEEAANLHEEDDGAKSSDQAELLQKQSETVPQQSKPDVEINAYFKDSKYAIILTQCVKAFEECLTRFSSHHKSYFRLSYTYFKFGKDSIGVCRDWLLRLGEKKKIPGLFGERKPNNFFNGIWRSPVDDIDRTGSFPYHMSKTIKHLLQVLDCSNDHEMIADVAFQLSKVPDPDKQYLYNFEREMYCHQAVKSCAKVARRYFDSTKGDILDTAVSIFSSYAKLQKLTIKENPLSSLLLESYRIHLENKGIDSSNVNVEHAFRYFQQIVWTTKIQSGTSKATGYAGRSGISGLKNMGNTIRKPYDTQNNLTNGVSTNPSTSAAEVLGNLSSQVPKRKRASNHSLMYQYFEQQKRILNQKRKSQPKATFNTINQESAVVESENLHLRDPYQLALPSELVQQTSNTKSAFAQPCGEKAVDVFRSKNMPCEKRSSYNGFENLSSYQASNAQVKITGGHPTLSPGKIQKKGQNVGQTNRKKYARLNRPDAAKNNVIQRVFASQLQNRTSGKSQQSLSSGKRLVPNIRRPCSTPNPPPRTVPIPRTPPSSTFYPVINFNTSPFRAQANIMLSPKELFRGDQQAKDPLSLSPPKAHSHFLSNSYNRSNQGIIDLTTNCSMRTSNTFHGVHPETTVYESSQHGARSVTRRRSLVDQPPTKPIEEKVYPLPPKKKRIALDLISEQPPNYSYSINLVEDNNTHIEIITLD